MIELQIQEVRNPIQDSETYRICVTGGAGFVGRSIVKRLKTDGNEVTSVDIVSARDSVIADITDRDQVIMALKQARPDCVIHLAGLAGAKGRGGGAESVKYPYDYFNVNIGGTLNVFDACKELRINHVLCMSSFSVYGRAKCPINEETPLDPTNPYGASKVCVEQVAQCYASLHGIRTVIFRPTLICGEGQTEVNALREFALSAVQNRPIIVLGWGKHVREFIHPDDVASAFSAGIEYVRTLEKPYEVFVLGSKSVSMLDLANRVIQRVGRGTVSFGRATGQVFDQYTDHSKATRVLGWSPKVGLDEIIHRVVVDAESRRPIAP